MIEVEDTHSHHHLVGAWPPTWQARLGLLSFAVVVLGLNATGVVRQILGLETAPIIAALGASPTTRYLGGFHGWVRKDRVKTAIGDPASALDERADRTVNNGITGDARRSTVELRK